MSGLRWGVAMRLISQLFTWGVTIYVMRLLAPSDYGLLFHPDSPPAMAFGETPVHPTQLYEALLLLGLFGWLVHRFRARKFSGELILHYGIGYAVIRFLLEFLRADDRGFYAGPLSISQIISIAVLGVAISFYALWRRPSPVRPD